MLLLRHLKKEEGALLILFSLLDLLLWGLCHESIPKHYVHISLICLLGVLTIPRTIPHISHAALTPSKTFSKQFLILSAFDFFFLVVVPWIFIVLELLHGGKNTNESQSAAQQLLGPHLFLFQAQIALESLVMNQGAWTVFGYTCMTNTYRVVAIVEGLKRALVLQEDADATTMRSTLLSWVANPIQMTIGRQDISYVTQLLLLLATMIVLWIASSVFIVWTWYPELPPAIHNKHTKKC